MVNTKDQSNAIVYCVLCMLCCLLTVSIYTEKIIQMFGGCLLISLHACINSVNMWHNLDLAKVAFLAYQFLVGRFS